MKHLRKIELFDQDSNKLPGVTGLVTDLDDLVAVMFDNPRKIIFLPSMGHLQAVEINDQLFCGEDVECKALRTLSEKLTGTLTFEYLT